MHEPASNAIWRDKLSPEPFETRAHRFRDDLRPVLMRWLGISPEDRVLDGGCGSGVFTRYLCKGLTTGHVTGFDINAGFIEYGRRRAAELGLEDKMTLEVADGFRLPYADGAFDAVTNYTYLGVLSDPEAGLRELIRVCRPGGVVSYVIAMNLNTHWQGDYPFEGGEELQRLATLEDAIFVNFARSPSDMRQSQEWPEPRMPKLFDACGLADIRMYPLGHLICYDDEALPFVYRRDIALREAREDIDWLQGRYAGKEAVYTRHGFGAEAYARLLELYRRKLAYLESHFGEARCFEWHGGFNFIVTGRKAG